MKLAIVSLNQIWEEKEANLSLYEKYIQKASHENIDLIIFPEMTLTGFSNSIIYTAEEFDTSKTIQTFSCLANKFNIAIVFGITIRDGDRALNQSIFMNTEGCILEYYSKIHPFSFAKEDKYSNAGDKLSIVNFQDINIGLSIKVSRAFIVQWQSNVT